METLAFAFELNELVALGLVLVALVAAAVARAAPSNTPRTREWWSRFVVFLALLLLGQIATNAEEFWPDTAAASQACNALEHLLLLASGGWALLMAVKGLEQAQARAGEAGERS